MSETTTAPRSGSVWGEVFTPRIVVVWAVLVVATIASWLLGHDHASTGSTTAISTIVLVVAMVKVDLVGRYFMELRDAPRGLRLAFDGWCVGVGILLLAMYLVA